MGQLTRQDAKRKAKYSKYDWIVWKDRDGTEHASRITAAAVKAAMLAMGTQGRFTIYERRTGAGHSTSWRIAVNIYAHLQRGWYY